MNSDKVLACTVEQLIAHLQTMPPNAKVIYSCCSDYSPLELDDVTLLTCDSKTRYSRNGEYKELSQWERETLADPSKEKEYLRYYTVERLTEIKTLQFETVVHFPGN